MSTPRLVVDLKKIKHNASVLVKHLLAKGISVTAVTKATLSMPEVARVLLSAGVCSIADSRIENLERLRRAQVQAPLILIRSPMLSQAKQVVANADVSFNTESEVIQKLASAARESGKEHGVVLMVELGDLREGILPIQLNEIVRKVLQLSGVSFKGIGGNLACRCGVIPDNQNMGELSSLAESIESTFGIRPEIVSGGNSANLHWALSDGDAGRINNLRLGESLLLGCDPINRKPIAGLFTDAIALIAEVIEAKRKPSLPWGQIAQSAFGKTPTLHNRGDISQAILAIGQQDIDSTGLTSPVGITILGASSDHLIMDTGRQQLTVGDEVSFQLNYSALLRAMTSPFIAKVVKSEEPDIVSTDKRPIA